MNNEKEINIIALEFPENVRTRPGMYIGATDCPNVILREAIDNSIDELMGSISCNRLDVQIKSGQQGGWYVVADNGRGIPIIMDNDKNITKTELAVASLNAGSKFKKESGDVSVGLNGVGVSCTNALSSRFVILSKITEVNARLSTPDVEALYNQAAGACEIFYVLEFAKGIKVLETAMTKSDIESDFGFQFPDKMSTVTAFIPDPDIWDSIEASYSRRSLAYVGVILSKFYDKTAVITIDGKEVKEFHEPYQFEFIKEVKVEDRNTSKQKQAKFYINFDVDTNLSITDASGSINSLIVDRGLHIDWTKKSFMEALKYHFNIQHDYLSPGLKYNVICMTSNMDFSSQTKERCVKIDGLYLDEVMPELVCEFHNIFHKNAKYFEDHVNRLKEYADALTQISAIQKVKAVVGTVEGGNRVRSKLPSSVKDAASNDRDKCELFICFKGDTKVMDCNGNSFTFTELEKLVAEGTNIYTLSCDEKGSVFPSKIIWAGKTGTSSQMIKITLDNGESFECTPNHEFLMLDGTYKEASKLAIGESCMPLYIGYIDVDEYDGGKRRVVRSTYDDKYDSFRHVYNTSDESGNYLWYMYRIMGMHPDVIDNSTGNDIVHIHHVDDLPDNDYPSNLIRVDQSWHLTHHGGLGLLRSYNSGKFNRFFGMDDAKRASISKSLTKFWNSEDGTEQKKYFSEIAKSQWSNPELRAWKAEDNRRWARENPEEASDRACKAMESRQINYIYEVRDELINRSLDLTIVNFDLIGHELYPTRWYKFSSLYQSYPDEFDWIEMPEELKNLNYDYNSYSVDKKRISDVLKELETRNLELTLSTFNEVSSELDWGWYTEDKWELINVLFKSTLESYRLQHNKNHKITKIEVIDYENPIDVYCLRVDNDLHNFPLAAGIFAHNCEGKSAAGTMLKSRNPEYHAILELRGVPLNAINLDLDTIMDNQEMNGIVTAIGAGVNEYFNIDSCRYGKVILAADSDIDGERINSMILGFIARKMTFLIEAGRVYVALAPLYHQGNIYVYPGEDPSTKIDMTKPFRHYKGLGEINIAEAKEFFFDENKRNLIKITPANLTYVFELLTMSSRRKELMIRSGVVTDKYNTGIV